MALNSPGIENKESSIKSITSSGSNGSAGLVGQFAWGPAFEITQVTDVTNLETIFGLPNDITAPSFFTGYNFLNYGNDLRVVRVVNEDTAQNSSTIGSMIEVSIDTPGTGYATTVVNTPNPTQSGAGVSVSGNIVTFPAGTSPVSDPSISGSFITILYNNVDLVLDTYGKPVIGYVETDEAGAIISAYVPKDVILAKMQLEKASISDFKVQFGGTTGTGGVITLLDLSTKSDVYFANETKAQSQFENTDPNGFVAMANKYLQPAIASVYPGDYGDNIKVAIVTYKDYNSNGNVVELESFPTGEWLSVGFKQYFGSNGPQNKNQYGILVYMGSAVVEQHIVSTDINDVDIYGSSIYMDNYFANGKSEYIFMSTNGFISRSGQYSLGGGYDELATAGEYTIGWDYFSDPDIISIDKLMTGGSAALGVEDHTTVAKNVMGIAEGRGDTVACIDPPIALLLNKSSAQCVDALVGWRTGTDTSGNPVDDNINYNTSYAVIVGNIKFQYDQYNDIKRWLPLSGDIAGTFAYTDQVANTWDSPAGFTRGQIKNVARLGFDSKQPQRDSLYSVQINAVISKSNQGTVLYGDKTAIAVPTPFDRINVRRLFNMVKSDVGDSSAYTLFENNTEYTRASWKSSVDSYLEQIQSKRGIVQFKTVCDSTNNDSSVIDNDQFVGTIYIQPPRSINFITLNYVATSSGVDINELV